MADNGSSPPGGERGASVFACSPAYSGLTLHIPACVCVCQEAGIQHATAGLVFIFANRKFQRLVQHSSYVEHHDHGSVWQVMMLMGPCGW